MSQLYSQDIVSSEVGYLGYKNSESYGLTWKVRETDSSQIAPPCTTSFPACLVLRLWDVR